MECKKRKKGYLKIHVAVDVKSKKILSMMNVSADKRVHDGKMLSELVWNIIKSNKIVGKLFTDGVYEGSNIFRYQADNGILPCTK